MQAEERRTAGNTDRREFGNLHYALTTVHTTEIGTVNLIGVPVAVSGDKIIMNFVDSTMLWTLREDTVSGFTIANNGFYLNRTSKFPGVYISHFKLRNPIPRGCTTAVRRRYLPTALTVPATST